MKKILSLVMTLLASTLVSSVLCAADIINPSFENGWDGWIDGDPSGSGTSISGEANTGEQSAKLSEASTYVTQTVTVEPNTAYRLKTYISGAGNLGVKVGKEIFFEQQPKTSKSWRELEVSFNSGDANAVSIFGSHAGYEVRFDDFSLTAVDKESVTPSARIISSRAGGYGLSPDFPPGKNFDLLGWYLNTPGDQDGDGISDRFSEVDLAKGAFDQRFFYTADDGGMVFRATIGGAKTSKNTSFTRTELREMLRRGDTQINTKLDGGVPNKNNWVFSSAPVSAQEAAGGVDGILHATLAVNHVTTTGDLSEVGRVIIGQIHADVDEPIRLYYRKLPGNKLGSVYVAHEVSGGDDIYFELIGERSKTATNPEKGIALNEKFSYVIRAEGDFLYVGISQDDKVLAETTIDISDSGYDIAKDYMYFKAGVYNQNKSGDPNDFVQATFYELEASHDVYSE